MKIGDTVLVEGGRCDTELYSGEITGETKTSWRVEYNIGKSEIEGLYYKHDLRLRGRGDWGHGCIKEFDSTRWRTHCRMIRKINTINRLKKFNWDKLELDDLEKLHNKAYDLANRS